jgi:hypothetical protein
MVETKFGTVLAKLSRWPRAPPNPFLDTSSPASVVRSARSSAVAVRTAFNRRTGHWPRDTCHRGHLDSGALDS